MRVVTKLYLLLEIFPSSTLIFQRTMTFSLINLHVHKRREYLKCTGKLLIYISRKGSLHLLQTLSLHNSNIRTCFEYKISLDL